jgi:hypothetical protein
MVRHGNTVETLQGLFSWAQFVHRQSGSDMEQQVQSSSNTWSSKSSTSCQGSNQNKMCPDLLKVFHILRQSVKTKMWTTWHRLNPGNGWMKMTQRRSQSKAWTTFSSLEPLNCRARSLDRIWWSSWAYLGIRYPAWKTLHTSDSSACFLKLWHFLLLLARCEGALILEHVDLPICEHCWCLPVLGAFARLNRKTTGISSPQRQQSLRPDYYWLCNRLARERNR